MEHFRLRISDQRSSFLRFIFKNSEPIIGMKSDAHKLSIVILQDLVGKKLRIDNGKLRMEDENENEKWKMEDGRWEIED